MKTITQNMIRTTDMIAFDGLSVYAILPSVYHGGAYMISKIEPGNKSVRNVVFGTKGEMICRIQEIKALSGK